MTIANEDDVAAIGALIARQFASLGWAPGRPADWDGFRADFVDGAPLHPSARPTAPMPVDAFVARMQGLSQTTLPSFDEVLLGTEIRVFGNIAVAAAGCRTTENGADTAENVEMLLLVKSDGRWRIAAQAWDRAGPARPLPASLASPAGEG